MSPLLYNTAVHVKLGFGLGVFHKAKGNGFILVSEWLVEDGTHAKLSSE